ncbi:MAG TPA: FtsX-like permease family protein [Tepidisphaeraceae bacterium]|nr:FtsX-like permease family protein [Tepidisphaeraceae bacterium]
MNRQIKLPLSQAVGIAYRNIRLRLSRSLVVTSGIVLAMAFLMSIMCTEALHDGMRNWLADARQASTKNASLKGAAGPAATQRLEERMRAKGVAVTAQEAAAGQIQTRWVLGLALAVAFVGILNAMLMSVTERFREIGTMKCLGALDGFIVKLYLIESLFQGVAGTIVGAMLGLALSIASAGISFGRFAWINAPAGRIAAAVAICIAVGVTLTVAAAVYPAWQAARMQPIEAMRVDT